MLALSAAASPAWAQVDGTAPAGQSDQITLNLQDVDIRVLINTVAEVTGRNFVVDPRVKGKVSIISGSPLGSEQLYNVFLSILEVHNFAAVESDTLIKILPNNVIKQRPTRTEFTETDLNNDSQITQIIQLEHASVAELVPIIRPLVPPTSHFAAHGPSNTLVVTDTASNIKRMLEIINRIDVEDQRTGVHVVYLKYADANELAGTLTQLANTMTNSGEGAPGTAASTIQAHPSINALVLNSSDTEFATLLALIDQLDIERPVEGDVHVIYLNHADATGLVSILSSKGLGASSKSKCASSKNKTNFGFSASPTSGSVSNNSDSSHNKKFAYNLGEVCMTLVTSRILITPRPEKSLAIKSLRFIAGLPMKISAPCSSSTNKPR